MFVLLSLYTGIFYPSRFGGAESNILCLILWGGAFNTCAPVASRFAPSFNYWGVLGRFIICFCCGAFYKVNPRAFGIVGSLSDRQHSLQPSVALRWSAWQMILQSGSIKVDFFFPSLVQIFQHLQL